jgi:hypothetical protein
MRRIIISLWIISGVLLLSASKANACGGTLTRVGDGPSFVRDFAKEHPAKVLIDARPNVAALQALAPQIQNYLKKVGHQSTTVNSEAELIDALKKEQYDVVLTDFTNVASIQSLPSHPVIVPLAYKLSKAEKVIAQKYSPRIENPENGDAYLEAIYKVMTSKARKLAAKI